MTESFSVEEIKALQAHELADIIDCQRPDSPSSPGAVFLAMVRSEVVSAIEYHRFATEDRSGVISEIAADAPDVYSYGKWLEFVDLCAWSEQADDGEWSSDLDTAGSQALRQIAERLAYALVEGWEAHNDEQADEDEDEDEEPCHYCGGLEDQHAIRDCPGVVVNGMPVVVVGLDDLRTTYVHSDYPHEAGRLYGCPACQAACHCGRSGTTPCVHCDMGREESANGYES